ncbi:hypothetical protein GCM10019059_43090 [Camelimonas fluminis]|nr:hypothetical protein GCM10019059_43090 [Camelimonas fluminis]
MAPEPVRADLAEAMHRLTAYGVSSQRLWHSYTELVEYPAPLMVLEDGVDLDLFRPQRLERFDETGARSLIVGWVGNSGWAAETEDYKGVHTLLRPAVEKLQAEGLPIELRLADRQLAIIAHAQMPDFYAGIDVYVCASKIEGTPNPVLEAMACGVPIISTDVGLVPEVFGSLQNEFILTERTASAIEAQLRRLFNERSLLKQLSQENLRSISGWDWANKARAYGNFFDASLVRHRKWRAHQTRLASVASDPTSFSEEVVTATREFAMGSDICLESLKEQLVVCMLFYNKLEQTIESIESFLDAGVRVNLMDNGSEENAALQMRAHFASNPLVQIVSAGCNAGVSGGRNRQLAATDARWLFFVDNDISVQTDDWLERLASAMRRAPEADIYVPRLFNKHEDAWGQMFDFVVDAGGNCAFIATASEFSNAFPGGASIVNRRVFERHGLYDENLFVGFEDFELAIRAWRDGRPLIARHVDDIVLLHDHRVSQTTADKKTALVRYDTGHINHSHAVVQRKHGILLDPNFGDWLKDQVRQLTGENVLEPSDDATGVTLHALSGATVRPRYCGDGMRILVLVDCADESGWLSLRSAAAAAKRAQASGAAVIMRVVGASSQMLMNAVTAGLLSEEDAYRSSHGPDAIEPRLVVDVICCMQSGLISADFLIQLAQEERFGNAFENRIYAPERVMWVSRERAGVQLERLGCFDALTPWDTLSPFPVFAFSARNTKALGDLRTHDLAECARHWLMRLVASGSTGFGVPGSLAIVAVSSIEACRQHAHVQQLHGAELECKHSTWVFLEQENLRDIALQQDTASVDWATLPKGRQSQDAIVSASIYPVLCRLLEAKISHVLIAPWLKRGGADKATLAYLLAIAEKLPGRVLLITTENSESPWLSRLPNGVEVINWHEVVGDVHNTLARQSLTWMLLRLRPAVVHVMNSWLGWEMLATEGMQLRAVSKTFASLFWYGPSERNRIWGYAAEYLRRVERNGGVDLFITDITVFAQRLLEDYGVSGDRFKCVWHPTTYIAADLPASRPREDRSTVLWASRFAPEKRVDLLLQIVKKCPDYTFIVYGELEDAHPSIKQHCVELLAQGNVLLGGAFDDFHVLPLQECDAFLYTSSSDGMPNVLIEAMAHGLPVVSSIVGGIGDLVNEETGWPVYDVNKVDAYCSALHQLFSGTEDARGRARSGLERVAQRHSFGAFSGSVQAIPGYGLLEGAS